MSPSVAFVQRRVPHYREAFFAGLHDDLRERGISLDVMVAGPAAEHPPAPAPWLSVIGGRRIAVAGREVIWQNVLRATAAHDLVITELSPRIISNVALLARSRRGGPRVGGFGHGRNFASTRIPGPRSAHARLVRSLDWWFAYNDLSRDAVMALGFPADRVTAVNNTIDTRLLADAVAAHRRAGIADLRRSLGIGGTPVAVFCGSLYERKRLDFIFDAVLRLRHGFPDLNLLVLGDGPCEGEVGAFADAHDWVHYAGRIVGAERARYLAVADVMLMPGLVGLVVLDSFAARVPLVTTDWPFHSPEIQYLRHAENGWRSPNTLDAYVDAVALLLGDRELRERLQRGCDEATARYPMEGMVTRFAEGIVGALGSAGKRST
ncbi:MAG: glycosyltransferase family 4 protein [Solirubrobacteraceae bacterium]